MGAPRCLCCCKTRLDSVGEPGAWATGAANSPRWRRMQLFLHGAWRGRQMRSLGCLNVCVARYAPSCGACKVGDVDTRTRTLFLLLRQIQQPRTTLIRVRTGPGGSKTHPLSQPSSLGTIARVPSPRAHRSTSSVVAGPKHSCCTRETGAERICLNSRHS